MKKIISERARSLLTWLSQKALFVSTIYIPIKEVSWYEVIENLLRDQYFTWNGSPNPRLEYVKKSPWNHCLCLDSLEKCYPAPFTICRGTIFAEADMPD